MLGDNLLVAPMFAGETTRKVFLPAGRWYDFYSGKYAGSGEVIEVAPGLNRIPVYAKDSALIPMIPAAMRAPRTNDVLPLEIRHYGTSEGSFNLYDDDGETFNYEKGEFTWTALRVKKNERGGLQGEATLPKTGRYRDAKWTFMTK